METTVPETVPYIAPAIGVFCILFIVLVSLIGVVLTALIYCMIFSKAGYSWALSSTSSSPKSLVDTTVRSHTSAGMPDFALTNSFFCA